LTKRTAFIVAGVFSSKQKNSLSLLAVLEPIYLTYRPVPLNLILSSLVICHYIYSQDFVYVTVAENPDGGE